MTDLKVAEGDNIVTYLIWVENMKTYGLLTVTNGLDKMYQVHMDKEYLN